MPSCPTKSFAEFLCLRASPQLLRPPLRAPPPPIGDKSGGNSAGNDNSKPDTVPDKDRDNVANEHGKETSEAARSAPARRPTSVKPRAAPRPKSGAIATTGRPMIRPVTDRRPITVRPMNRPVTDRRPITVRPMNRPVTDRRPITVRPMNRPVMGRRPITVRPMNRPVMGRRPIATARTARIIPTDRGARSIRIARRLPRISDRWWRAALAALLLAFLLPVTAGANSPEASQQFENGKQASPRRTTPPRSTRSKPQRRRA